MDESFAQSMKKLIKDIKKTEKEVAKSLGLRAPLSASSPTVPKLKRNRDVETETKIYKSAKTQSQNFDSNFFPWSNASNSENGIFAGDYCRIVLENSDEEDVEMMPARMTTKSSLFPKNSQKNSSDDISMAAQWRYSLGDPPSKKFGTKEWIEFQKRKWDWQLGRKSPNSLRREKSLFDLKSFKNNELLESNWRKQWRDYLGDPPLKKYVEDWIVFQKTKWDWQRQPEPLKILLFTKKSFNNNELESNNWRKHWRVYLGDPPPIKYSEDWIVFQKAKWDWQRQPEQEFWSNNSELTLEPEPLKISLFTKKFFKNNELESNNWRKQWRVYLGDPPPIKYSKDWIVFQKAKWDWQRQPEPEEEEPEPENADEEDEQDEEEEQEEDEETRNFDIRAKNKIFNIFANVIGSLAISNNTDEVAVKKDVNQELHEDLMDGLKEKNIITDDQIDQIATEVEENEDLETNADRDQYMQNAVSREIFHGFANLHNIPVEKRKYFKDSVNEEDSST